MRSHILVLLASSFLVVTASACKKDKAAGGGTDTTAAASTQSSDTAALAPPPAPNSTPATEPAAPTKPEATATAVIHTSMGDIELELYGKDAPKAVENFIGHAKKNYYNGVAFHRCIPGFMIQGGDPNSKDESNRGSWGQGGQSIWGQPFEDELNPNAPSYKIGYTEGTLAMANAGPNTNGSQFFIMSTDNPSLPKSYTIFGHVTKGMDVVQKIVQTGAQGDQPQNPARIKSVTAKAAAKSADAAPAGDTTHKSEAR